MHQDGEPLHGEVLAQWESANPDRARLHALVDQRIDAMRAFAHQAVDAGIEVHGVLTPEQRAKLEKKVAADAPLPSVAAPSMPSVQVECPP